MVDIKGSFLPNQDSVEICVVGIFRHPPTKSHSVRTNYSSLHFFQMKVLQDSLCVDMVNFERLGTEEFGDTEFGGKNMDLSVDGAT